MAWVMGQILDCPAYITTKKERRPLSRIMLERFQHYKNGAWESGLFSDTVLEKPVTHGVAVTRWKPILPIPMDRVHIGTLHAQNRIIKKIMHLHFMFVWMIRDKREQKLAIDEMQRVLSATGAHGREVNNSKG